jgi:signal transduction histidine kinase
MPTSIRLVRQFSIASLVAVLIVAFALASFYAWKAQAALVEQGEHKNATQVRLILNQLDATDRTSLDELLALKQKPAADSALVKHMLQTFTRSAAGTSLVKLKLYNAQGLTVFSSEASQIGEDKSDYPGFTAALRGSPSTQLSERESFESMFGTLRHVAVIGSYLPVHDRAGAVIGVIEVYDDVTQLLQTISTTRWQIFGLSAVLVSTLYVALLFIARRAGRTVEAKERALEREVAQRGRVATEAKRAQHTTEKAQRETEKAYAAAIAARRVAEEANQAKTELLGKLGEEMRTPLNGMIGTTDVLLTGELSAPQREHVARIRASATALLRLVNDLFAVAQPETETHGPRLEALSPLTLAREATSLHTALAKANGLTMDCRATSNVPAWALGDARRLRLLLTDLIGVAGRSGRGKTVLIVIDRVADAPGLVLRFTVRMESAQPASSNAEPLDLQAAKRLAARIQGSIDADAAPGQPLVLRLDVPLRPAGLETTPEAVPGLPTEAAP